MLKKHLYVEIYGSSRYRTVENARLHGFQPFFLQWEISMLNTNRSLLIAFLFLTLFMAGCSGRPTRHLVSDVAMIQAGQSTREDVTTLMGEPDTKRMVGDQIEEWTYYEEDRSTLQGTPFVGEVFGADGYNMVIITFMGDIVKTCNYRGYNNDEFDWKDDYSWQETEKK